MEWIRFHFFHHERQAQTLLSGVYEREHGAENEPEYWKTVTGLVLQGRLDDARSLLKLHSATGSEQLKLADQLMRTMPLYNVSKLNL
jgi:Nup85 Nucleoporin.